MKNNILNYKGALFSIAAASVIFAGCGSNDIDDVYAIPEKTTSNYTIKVVDDDVVGATISTNECTGYEELGNGYYKVSGCYTKPKAIISSGGSIDTTGDGNGDTEMDFPLILNTDMFEGESFVITPLTTLLSTVSDYAELEAIRSSLGFDNIQDMFKDTSDDADKTAIQQQINGFFISAKNSGLDLNKFDLLSEQLRSNIVAKKDAGTATEVLLAAQKKFKDDFDDPKLRAELIDSYGIVFSGFVSEPDYNETNPKSFLKNISEKYTSNDKTSLVFSGFVYDDIIGTGNSDRNYTTEATIKLIDLNSTTTVFTETANNFGSWKKKDINISTIENDHLYNFEASITGDKGDIVLKSLLKGSEILDNFKSKINTKDLPDLTISNVTTAKYACWEKSGKPSNVLQFKQNFEKTDNIIDLSGFIKSMVDGSTTFSGSSYNNLLNNMGDDCSLTATNVPDLEDMITKTKADTTLKKQFESTVIKDITLTEDMFKNINLVYKNSGDNKKYELTLFANNSFILKSKDSYQIGEWAIVNNKLKITTAQTEFNITFSGTISTDKKTSASFKNGKFVFTEGLKARIIENSYLLDIANINDIDLTKDIAPLVKFEASKLENQVFYEVYKDTNGVYQDRFIKILKDGNATVNEDVASELDGATDLSWTISNGVLTIASDTYSDTYKVKSSSATKIVCTKNIGEASEAEIELFYSNINAAAAKEIKEYEVSQYVQDISFGDILSNINNQQHNSKTITSDSKLKFVTKPIDDDANDYGFSYSTGENSILSTKSIGAKIKLTQTFNIGNSDNQTSGYSLNYNLPACNDSNEDGELQVKVLIRGDKVQYNLLLKKSDGDTVGIFENPVTIIEESTLNKVYDVMVIYLDNKIAVRVSDDQNSYYQYSDYESLRKSKSELLAYYKYPTQLNSLKLFNSLNKQRYEDGTSIYKDYNNQKVEMEVTKASIINGKNDNNYKDGNLDICNTGTTVTQTTSNIFSGLTWENITKDDSYTTVGNSVNITATKTTLTTKKAEDAQSRTEILTKFDTKKSKVSSTVNLVDASMSKYNRVTFRTYSDLTITDDLKSALGLSSNNVTSYCVIQIKGKYLGAYIELTDGTKDVTVFNQEMYYNENNADLIGKNVNLTIENIGNSVYFKATADGLTINNTSFTRPDGVTWAGIKAIAVRTDIKDDIAASNSEEAGETVKAEVTNITTVDYSNPTIPYSEDITYSPAYFIKISSSDVKWFDKKTTGSDYDATTFTNISNLPTDSNLYSLGFENGMVVEKLDVSTGELQFISVYGTKPAENLGAFTTDSEGKMIFADKEMKYTGSFNANQLNTTTETIFSDTSKAYAIYEKTTQDSLDIYDGNNSTGFNTLESFITSHSGTNYMYEIAPNSGIAFSDANSTSYTQEVNINGTSITNSGDFENIVAADVSTILNTTMYELGYNKDWDDQLQKDVWGSEIDLVTLTNTTFSFEELDDTSSYKEENNISISNNIITEQDGKFKIKYIETINASTLNQTGFDIFTNGNAYKMAYFRYLEENEWHEDNWAYPTYYDQNTSSNTNFTDIQEYVTWTYNNWFEGNGDYSYVFAQDSNITAGSGNLVDQTDKTTVVGTWQYTNGIIKADVTNSNYWWDSNDPWMPTIRLNNGIVQRGEYGKANVGSHFYMFDETAKNEWLTFFGESTNGGSLNYISNGNVMSTAGTWSKTSIDGYEAIKLDLESLYNPEGITPVRVLKDGVVQEAELRKAGESSIHYLFDENGKNDWLKFYSPYPQNPVINAMFENITNTATVTDAKTMVGTLRDLSYSVYREDNSTGTVVESGLIISEDALHTDKVQSVLDQFETDLNATTNNIDLMTETFSDNVEADLNSTRIAIKDRLDAISLSIDAQTDANATNISVTSENETINFTVTYDSEGEIVTAQAQNQTLTGTGYSLNISSMAFNYDDTNKNATANLSASAQISANNTTFNGTLNISGDIDIPVNDEDNLIPSDINSLNFVFDGDLTSNGRVLDGNISLTADSNISFIIEGNLQGLTNEPKINGKVTASAKLLDLDKVTLRGEEVEWAYVSNEMNYNEGSPILYNNNGTYLWVINSNGVGTYTVSNGTTTLNISDDDINLIRANSSSIKVALTNGSNINQTNYLGSYDTYFNGSSYILNMNLNDEMGGRLELSTENPTVVEYVTWDQNTYSEVRTQVNMSIVSVETRDEDLSSGSMAFIGTVEDGNNTLSLNLFANILSQDEIEAKATNLTLTNKNVTLAVDEVKVKANEKTKEFNLAITNLSGTAIDTDGQTLTLTVSGNMNQTFKEFEEYGCMYGDCTEEVTDSLIMDLNVSYTYRSTSVNGALHTNFSNMAWEDFYGEDFTSDSQYLPRGYSKFKGDVSANNFVPFDITLEQKFSTSDKKTESFVMLINTKLSDGSDYSVAGKMLQEYKIITDPYNSANTIWSEDNQTIELIDSNGVISYDKGYDLSILFLRDKDAVKSPTTSNYIGAVNLDTNEVTYSDGSAELF